MAKFSASISRWPVNMSNTGYYGISGLGVFTDSTPSHSTTLYREKLTSGNSVVITGTGLTYDSTTDPGYYWPRSGLISNIAVSDSSGFAMYSWSNLSTSFESIVGVIQASGDPHWQQVNALLLRSNDIIEGSSFADTLNGYDGNDFIDGSARNDTIDGGAGIDSAYLRGFKSQYTVNHTVTGLTTSGPDGTDTLRNIERLRFDDITVAFDVTGNAGQAYRLYRAALDRAPDSVGLGAQVYGLDAGMSLQQIAQNFINSAEFQTKYGAGLSNDAFVSQLYANVLHRVPDAGGYAVQVNALDAGMSRAQLLVNFSESPENYNATIVGIQKGIDFVQFA